MMQPTKSTIPDYLSRFRNGVKYRLFSTHPPCDINENCTCSLLQACVVGAHCGQDHRLPLVSLELLRRPHRNFVLLADYLFEALVDLFHLTDSETANCITETLTQELTFQIIFIYSMKRVCNSFTSLKFVRAEDADLGVIEEQPQPHDVVHDLFHLAHVEYRLGFSGGSIEPFVVGSDAVEDQGIAPTRDPVGPGQLGEGSLRMEQKCM